MRPAYQRDTPMVDAINELETPASKGWIFSEYTSAVSQSGSIDGFQADRARACWRCVAPSFAKASGLCPATRPRRAAFRRRSVAVLTAHFAQCVRPNLMASPQPRQRFLRRGVCMSGGKGDLPLASRL